MAPLADGTASVQSRKGRKTRPTGALLGQERAPPLRWGSPQGVWLGGGQGLRGALVLSVFCPLRQRLGAPRGELRLVPSARV